MGSIRDIAICLRRWDFSETSQTVSLFTREHGIVRGLAKGAKRERSTFSGGFDVLTRGQIVAILKPGRDLALLTEWHLIDPYRVIRQHLPANRAAFVMADLVHHLVTDHDPHPALFDALVAGLDELAERREPGAILLAFQWTLLEEAGYRPRLDRDAASGAMLPDDETLGFCPRAGGVVARGDAQQRWWVRRTTVDLLRGLEAGAGVGDAPSEVVDRANRLLGSYAQEIVGREIPALRWAFGSLPDST